MAAYKNTYDDLLRDMKANNIQFSDYDLALAKQNPDAGRSLYTQKLAYGNATTDEERKNANQAAEEIRRKYGGYTAGSDGTGFTLNDQYAPQPSQYTSEYQDKIDGLLNQLTDRSPYTSQYQGKIDDLLDQILNREEFSYNPSADPSYQAYSEQYRNLGNQAMQNALGSAAAMNGGQLSSYALTAAQQAQNTYNSQLSEAIPELQQLAYEMYLNEGNQMRQNLSALMDQDATAYSRYLDDYNLDQSTLSALMSQDSVAYNRFLNERSDELDTWKMNYNVDRDALSDQRYNREWQYQLDRDAISDQRYTDETAYNREYTQNARDYDRLMDKAQLLGSAGDFSAYSELGYSDAEIRRLKNAYDQAQVASLVSSLGSSSSSGGSSSRSSKQSVSDSSEDAKQDYEGLFQLAYQNRANAKSVIANNYKKYGFTSQTGLYDEFQAWAEEHEGEQEEEQEEEDETASKLRLNQVLNLWNDVPKVGSSISAASASGYSEKSENYETVEKRLSEMDAEGASKAEILVALQRAKQQGVLNLTDYNKLFYKINN